MYHWIYVNLSMVHRREQFGAEGIQDAFLIGTLTWPMAKRLKLFGITYLLGKISRSNFFFQGPLAK